VQNNARANTPCRRGLCSPPYMNTMLRHGGRESTDRPTPHHPRLTLRSSFCVSIPLQITACLPPAGTAPHSPPGAWGARAGHTHSYPTRPGCSPKGTPPLQQTRPWEGRLCVPEQHQPPRWGLHWPGDGGTLDMAGHARTPAVPLMGRLPPTTHPDASGRGGSMCGSVWATQQAQTPGRGAPQSRPAVLPRDRAARLAGHRWRGGRVEEIRA
jgi:hypothetical protein